MEGTEVQQSKWNKPDKDKHHSLSDLEAKHKVNLKVKQWLLEINLIYSL